MVVSRMSGRWAAVMVGVMLLGAGAAKAQSLNDLGRVLQDQVLGGNRQQQDPNRERDAYERGRQDQADQARRNDDRRREPDRRQVEDDRRRNDDQRRGRDYDQQRPYSDGRGQDQPRRY